MTRLNPKTTPRHQLRAEKAAGTRKRPRPPSSARKPRSTRCSPACRRSATTTSTPTPTRSNWGHVGTLEHYASLLKRITDSAFKEGEHAN